MLVHHSSKPVLICLAQEHSAIFLVRSCHLKTVIHVAEAFIKVTVYLQIDNFVQIWIFESKYWSKCDPWFLKKILKKTKYWQRNRSFTFSPEVKVYTLIDSTRRLSWDCTDVKNWLLSYSVEQPPSIFLGAILYGMNKPRPCQCPWTSSKKQTKHTKNEITTMSKQAKVGEKLKLRLWGQACNRLSQELRKASNDSTCFFLAGLPLLIQSNINKRKSSCHFAWRNGSIAAWMFVHPANTAVILDLKSFLINQKLLLSTSEHNYYFQGRKWNMPNFTLSL